jgi:uncharacterized membrane protein
LNSWDLVVHPARVLRDVVSSFDEPWTVIRGGTATTVVATMLAVTYVTFYAVLSLRFVREPDEG